MLKFIHFIEKKLDSNIICTSFVSTHDQLVAILANRLNGPRETHIEDRIE